MNRRPRNSQSAFSNPVLVGAVTVLVAVVAVLLAYQANAGLPFVPTKQLLVDVPDGADLVVGNDVREGGFRIVLVSAMKPVHLAAGVTAAQLTLKLNEADAKLPVDSSASILSRSVLGLKYVNITKGTSKQLIPDGGTLPLNHSSVPVQLDQFYSAFNTPTRNAIQQQLISSGDILAGRGSALNDTIHSLPTLLGHLEPVARYLSDPSTELTRFLGSLNSFMGAVAPVSRQAAALFGDMATTFHAISASPTDLEQTIAKSPSTLAVSTGSLAAQQPFLVDLTTLGHNLTPATAELRAALPDINPAIEAGTHTLAGTPVLNAKLQQVMAALQQLALSPGTNVALNGLSDTVSTLNPIVRYLGPYVTVCNDWNYWWTNLAGDIDEATTWGFAQRALLNTANPLQANNPNLQGATSPQNGGVPNSPLGGDGYAHGPVYGAAVDNQGNADCETGQRGYPLKLNYFDPQGRLFDTDQHTPGNQGPTFTGIARVPKGETFSRNPQTGPQTPYVPSNP